MASKRGAKAKPAPAVESQQPSVQEQIRLAAKLPAKAKLLAKIDTVSAEDRARAGITDEMANAMVSSNQPQKRGIEVVKGPFQPSIDEDVIDQVRIIDRDSNKVLWSGDEKQYAALKRAVAVEEER